MVKNNSQIEVIFFDIGGVLLHIHPEKMIKKISTITNNPFSIVQDSFPHDAHDAYDARGARDVRDARGVLIPAPSPRRSATLAASQPNV